VVGTKLGTESSTRQQAGAGHTAKNELSEPRDPAGACSGGKFVVSRAGEAYDGDEPEVRVGIPNTEKRE
jgi:hypothetical protein